MLSNLSTIGIIFGIVGLFIGGGFISYFKNKTIKRKNDTIKIWKARAKEESLNNSIARSETNAVVDFKKSESIISKELNDNILNLDKVENSNELSEEIQKIANEQVERYNNNNSVNINSVKFD